MAPSWTRKHTNIDDQPNLRWNRLDRRDEEIRARRRLLPSRLTTHAIHLRLRPYQTFTFGWYQISPVGMLAGCSQYDFLADILQDLCQVQTALVVGETNFDVAKLSGFINLR